MADKEEVRKQMFIDKGYFTVDKLIKKLQELQQQGYGNELVGSDYEHYKYCEYDKIEKYVVVC